MVVTCVGFGTMFSLGVFLQPMSEAEGWSRTGISTAALLNFLAMGVGSFFYLVARKLAHLYGVAVMFGFAYGGVMPLHAILVREYFGARTMGTPFGAAGFASTLGMALGPVAGGWLYDAFGSYGWLFIGSSGIGLGAVAH